MVVQACAGEHDGTVVLHHVVGTGLSSVVDDAVDRIAPGTREIVDEEVPMRRLDDMLTAEGFGDRDIHFLKVDVEGFEREVLLGIDLKVWRPWIVLVEATLPNSTEQAHHEWEPLLLDAGYTFCMFDGLNRFYASPEHPEFVPVLGYPACVFDQPFVTPPHARLLREYDNLLAGNDRLQSLYDGALASYAESSAALEQARADFGRLEEIHAATVEDWKRLEAEYLKTVGDWEALDRAHRELIEVVAAERAVNAGLAAERDTLRDGIARMGAEFDDLREQRDNAVRELELIRQTLSWRCHEAASCRASAARSLSRSAYSSRVHSAVRSHEVASVRSRTPWAICSRRDSSNHSCSSRSASATGSTGDGNDGTTPATSSKMGSELVTIARPSGRTLRSARLADSFVCRTASPARRPWRVDRGRRRGRGSR